MKTFNPKMLKWLYVVITCIILAFPIYYGVKPAPYRPQITETIHELTELPKFIAHKSNIGKGVPNTLIAIQAVLSSPINGIELDIQLTKDNVPVVYHDNRLETLTNGKGSVSNYVFADLKKLSYIQSKESIISLEEVFKLVRNQKYLFLNVKEYGFNNNLSEILHLLIEKYQLQDSVIIESFNPFFLYSYRKISLYGRIMYDFTEDSTLSKEESQEQLNQIPWLMKQAFFQNWVNWIIKPDLLGPRFSTSLSRIRQLANAGYPLIVWIVDEPILASRFFANGVTGVISNEPLLLYQKLNDSHGEVIMDASRDIPVKGITRFIIRDQSDITNALIFAKNNNRKISISGRRHTQGGHTFDQNNVVLDMKPYNKMKMLNDGNTLQVQSGATWAKVQYFLNKIGRSVKVMQSDNIFTVGGTISVNAHGWQVGSAPVSSTVKAFSLMLASGDVIKCSRNENEALFRSVLGGYGLFGVLLEIDIATVPNTQLRSHHWVINSEQYPEYFKKKVTENPNVELAYGRLSIDKLNFLNEAILVIYEESGDHKPTYEPLISEKYVVLKQKIFRNSQRNEMGKKMRWELEKNMNKVFENQNVSRNNVMSPDVHTLWPLDLTTVDILQEYFIPKEHFTDFVKLLKKKVTDHNMNLLNVTVREVRKDNDTMLNYAKEDVFSFVLFFSQDKSQSGEERMALFTKEIVAEILKLDGTFYLPYRPHYTFQQMKEAYPRLSDFLKLKIKYDPHELFSSQFYEKTLKRQQ
jgi:FAD/FMN-containing dehydrogenase/glycerophosphoryl diester phosphodiesterase